MALRSRFVLRFGSLLAISSLLAQTVAMAGISVKSGDLPPQMAERANPGKITGVKKPLPERRRGKRTNKDIRGLWTAKEARDHSNRIDDLNIRIALAEEEKLASLSLEGYLALFMQMSTPNNKQDGGSQPWENSSGGVNTATGGFQTVVPISSWPTKGNLVFDFHLIHSSKGQVTATQFGKRWKSSYDYFLHLAPTKATLEFPDGTSVPRDRSGNTTTKPAGFYEEISYNTSTSKWEMKTKDQTVYQFSNDATFDANFWFLTKITDRFGNYITINRGTAGRLLEVVDGANSSRAIEVVLPMSGNDLSLVDSMRGTTWDLDKDATTSTLTEVVYPAVGGSMPKRKFEYNTVDQITKDTDRRDKPTIYTYNGSGGDEYDDFSLATAKDPELNTTTYTYVKHPTLDQIDYTEVTDPASIYTRDIYDSDGMLEASLDGEGWWDLVNSRTSNHEISNYTVKTDYTYSYTYDSMGNVLTVMNPLSQVDTYTYNSTNDVLTYKNNANKTWTYTYYGTGTTAPGSLKEVTDPLTRTYPIAKFTRNAAGEPTEIFDGENLKTEITYNSHGDVTSVKAPDGTETTSFYGTGTDYNKNRGNAVYTTSPAGVTTSFVYDNWLRVTDVYAGDNPSTGTYEGDRTQIAYNAESAVTSTIDANSKTTTFSYDDNNDLISKTNAKAETETYVRDGRRLVTSITNGRGKTRTYEYTGRGEVTLLRLPGNSSPALPSEQYSYDGRGMLSAKSNAIGTNGQTVLYEYDEAGSLTKIDYPTGTDTTFTYDSRGRRSTMVDVSGTTTWTYNDADEVTQIAQPNGTISYEWRDNGQPKKRTEPGSITVTFGYDSYGRPTTTTRADSSWNDTTTIAYDSYGRPLTKTLDNTTKEHYEYDSLSRLNKVMVKNSAGTSTLRSQNWVYDGVGNMTSRTIEGVTTTYSYDNIHQLITESRSGSLLEYTYDANGNRLTKKENSTTVQNFSYTDDDRLVGNQHGTITYDAAGRPTAYPTASGTKYFSWDYDDRLLGYSNTSGGAYVEAQKYNGAGARVEFSSGGTTRKDLRTGIGVTAPVVSSAVGGSTTVSYLPGIAEKRGSTKSYQHSGLKNVDAQSNSSATISATREYDAFGGVITGAGTSGTFNGPFGHAGDFGYQSEGSGLQLLGHRWYDPEVGRFLTRDPIQDGRNWFAYCENNPLGRVDPSGLYMVFVAVNPGAGGNGSHMMIGIWSGNPNDPIWWFGLYSDGLVYTGDSPGKGADITGIDINLEQYCDLKKLLFGAVQAALNGQKKNYKLTQNNCSNWVIDILIQAGLLADDTSLASRPSLAMQDVKNGWGSSSVSLPGAGRLKWEGANPRRKGGSSSPSR